MFVIVFNIFITAKKKNIADLIFFDVRAIQKERNVDHFEYY